MHGMMQNQAIPQRETVFHRADSTFNRLRQMASEIDALKVAALGAGPPPTGSTDRPLELVTNGAFNDLDAVLTKMNGLLDQMGDDIRILRAALP